MVTEAPRWTRYVAIGDSFTEGLWDAPEGRDGPMRGWADLLAEHLSARRTAAGLPPLEYANLAVRGRLLRPIVDDQVPAALALRPDLVSIVGGGNDLLRPDGNPDRLARRLEAAVARLRASGADVLMATGFDTAESPVVRLIRPKVAVYNTLIWSIARRHGAHVVDLWGMRSLDDWRMWAEDRIHLTPAGHQRVAQAALVGLGLEPDDPAWDEPLAPLPPTPPLDWARANAHWLAVHAYPWATRRLHHQSSGDGRSAKRPVAMPVDAG
jgi:lysophospholipase L1-like esterase